MTGRELLEQLKKDNLLDEPLYLLIDRYNEYLSWCDTNEVTDYEVIDNKVYLHHEFYE